MKEKWYYLGKAVATLGVAAVSIVMIVYTGSGNGAGLTMFFGTLAIWGS